MRPEFCRAILYPGSIASPCTSCPDKSNKRVCDKDVTPTFVKRQISADMMDDPTCKFFEFNFSNALSVARMRRVGDDFINPKGETILRVFANAHVDVSDWFSSKPKPVTATVLVKNPLDGYIGYGVRNGLVVAYGVPFALSYRGGNTSEFKVRRPVVADHRAGLFMLYWKFLDSHGLGKS